MDALGRSNLTLAQWAFWTAHRLYPDKPLYNAAHSFTVNDHLDPDLFQRALQALVDSHDALRTVFAESAGVPERRVLPKLPVTLDRIDLSDASDPDAALHDWACCRAGHAFAAEDPLFDTAHVRLGPNRTAWYFNQHHLICDAWSSGLLVPRLAGFYADAAAGRLNGVAPFPHYDAFVEHEHALRQSDQGERASDYWRETLAHPPEPPAFYGRSNRSLPARVARCTCDLGVDRTRAIRDLAGRDGVFHKNANVTLSNIFFAVLAAFVSRVSGQGRLCIGQPHHNRDTDAFRDTAGLFLAMLPVCVDVTPEDTFLSLMDRVRTTIADGLRHRPCFAQNRTDARLFDVVLNFYNASFPDFNGVPIEQELYHPGWSLERLAVHVHDFTRTGRLHVYFDFDEAVFCEELRARAVTQFTNLLDAVIEDPARPLAACDFLTDDERQRVMGEWGGATAPGPDHPTITAWIESRAAERPDATAVDCEGRTLSYAQLNSRANQLARVLVRKGVGHESIVAICLGPTPEA
ncbi:MAG: AMP-binding protein, partial [bacterium]|nr:AMP-binding protein [bacterium]